MKCDKLKRFEIVGKYTDDETIGECYDADEVDAAIAELKEFAEDACLERDDNQTAIDELNAENRKLKRALWLARAEICRRFDVDRYLRNHRNSWYNENCLTWNDACVAMDVKMCKAERKCRAKAEEYK
jgi:hypothetical protein